MTACDERQTQKKDILNKDMHGAAMRLAFETCRVGLF
jgi:hypothetical protein